MTQRIQNAIDVFLDAINNGTLAKGTCLACAVGNLVAHGLGVKIPKEKIDHINVSGSTDLTRVVAWRWMHAKLDSLSFWPKEKCEQVIAQAKLCVDATEFNKDELQLIEDAFESNTVIDVWAYEQYSKEEIRKDQINGLTAVIEAMLLFDNQPDDVNEVFTSKAEALALV